MTGAAAVVGNARLDLLAANQLGRALFAEMYDGTAGPPNFARYLFLDERGLDFYADWARAANETVAILRAEAGRDPHDRDLSDLVGELSTQSDEFRVRWAKHDVRFHTKAIKHIHHPDVGDLELSFDRLDLAADPGLAIFSYTAEPGSKSKEALTLLGSWTAHRPVSASSSSG